jgi:GntR family transcriptional repressor for pyruvate dehydrogenase complex
MYDASEADCVAAPLTEAAIAKMREMIATGQLVPGARLPPEAELATQLGASRNTLREAVRALVTARVLDVRRGDGTYVTSLRPELLLEGIGFAAEMMQVEFSIDLIVVRRILEPAATAMAAARVDEETIGRLGDLLGRMRDAHSHEELVGFDAEFHSLVAGASGNATLASMLNGVSGRTTRARVWRAVVDEDAEARTIVQHADILRALEARDAPLAEAAALIHVATTEAWIRRVVGEASGGLVRK